MSLFIGLETANDTEIFVNVSDISLLDNKRLYIRGKYLYDLSSGGAKKLLGYLQAEGSIIE